MSNDAALKSVKRGDSPEVIFQVGDINAIHRHVRNAKQVVGNASNDELRSRESWRMKAKNTTVTDLARGVFVSLDGVLYSEADNDPEFKNRPTANIVALATGKVTAITADFIDAGNIGPVVTAGVWNAEVFVNATTHKYASILAGVMTSQQADGPVSIISVPASTGAQNCVVLLGGNSGYNGPYKVEATSATAISIGGNRAVAGYPFKDVTTAWQSDGTPVGIAKTTAESGGVLSGLTVSVYVYYACQRDSGSVWSMTPLVSETWPPAATATNKDQIFVPVAFVTMESGVITSIGQLLRGCPAIWERPILCNGQAVYANDAALVTGMTVNIAGTSQAIAAASFALSSATKVFVRYTFTKSTGAIAITSTYQSGATVVPGPTESSGVVTWEEEVAVIADNKVTQSRMGDINHPHLFRQTEYGGLNLDWVNQEIEVDLENLATGSTDCDSLIGFQDPTGTSAHNLAFSQNLLNTLLRHVDQTQISVGASEALTAGLTVSDTSPCKVKWGKNITTIYYEYEACSGHTGANVVFTSHQGGYLRVGCDNYQYLGTTATAPTDPTIVATASSCALLPTIGEISPSDDFSGTGDNSGSFEDANWLCRWATSGNGTPSLSGGAAVHTNTATAGGNAYVSQDNNTPDISGDFVCSVDLSVSKITNNEAGLIMEYTDSGFKWVEVGLYDGEFAYRKGPSAWVKTGTAFSGTAALELSRIGSTISMKINGSTIATVTTSVDMTRVVFASFEYTGTDTTVATWDNFVLTGGPNICC